MSIQENGFAVISYYAFLRLESPNEEVKQQKAILQELGGMGRLYLSEQGINAQLSLPKELIERYRSWVYARGVYGEPLFKVQYWHEHAFARLTVKYRRQLVALDREVDLSLKGAYLTPEQWRQKLDEEGEDFTLLDVRNQYEWEVGHFKGAKPIPCQTFREFTAFADSFASEHPKDKELLICCTGGIRCELYSALLREKGFTNVKQLEGGIINYGDKEGGSHWKGKLFVFDDRLTVPISDDASEVVGRCHCCEAASELYYNCANMDCNELFLSCPDCLKELNGCCCSECALADRVRPYADQKPHKPFRRRSLA